jgi:hypothetical protein
MIEDLDEDDSWDAEYLCLGICLPDDEAKHCIGCGRPWHQRESADWDTLKLPPLPDGEPEGGPDASG